MHILAKRFIASFFVAFIAMSQAAAEDVPFLLTAASKGDVAIVSALLESGASANVKDEEGVTALMYAARKDKPEVIAILLAKGADINARDKGAWTALIDRKSVV